MGRERGRKTDTAGGEKPLGLYFTKHGTTLSLEKGRGKVCQITRNSSRRAERQEDE